MYQKCVCFIFLMLLAVLSCYGFRIDNLAMTDLTKKNFHTSPNNYYSNTDRFIRADTVNKPHKIRHHRLWRTQAHTRSPKPPHIDAIIYPPPATKSISSTDFSSTNDKLIWPYKSSIESSESANTWPLANPSSSEIKLSHSELKRSEISEARNPWPVSIPSSEVIWPTRSSSEVVWTAHRISSEVSLSMPSSEANVSLASSTIFPDESLAQIPPTDFAPVKFVVSRSQRASEHNSKRGKNKWSQRQKEDIFAKAYRAEFVILAEVESRHINESNQFCEYYVKVIKDFKENVYKDFVLLHKSYRRLLTATCDLVKEMKNSKKYLLMLDKNLLPIDTPKPRVRPGMAKKLKRACKKGFVPTIPKVELREVTPKSRKKVERRNRMLICKAKGFPPPKITWRRRNEVLHHSRSSYNILYKRRQSKLIIKKQDAGYLGQYECIAENANGYTASQNITLLPLQTSESLNSGKECPDQYKDVFCQNGGKCFFESSMGILYCSCPENYNGEKCELKKPSNTSFYNTADQEPQKKSAKKKKKNRRH